MNAELMKQRIAYLLRNTHLRSSGSMEDDSEGFNYSDYLYFRDIIVTDDVLPEVAWKLKKYQRQLSEVNLYGDDLREVKQPTQHVAKKRAVREQSVVQCGKFVVFKFRGGQFNEIVRKMKDMGGRWSAGEVAWSVPAAKVLPEIETLKTLGFVMPDIQVSPEEIVPPSIPTVRLEGTREIVIHSPYNARLVEFFRITGGFVYVAADHSRKIMLDAGMEKISALIDLAKSLGMEVKVNPDTQQAISEFTQLSAQLESTKKDFSVELEGLNLKVKPFPYQMAGIKFIDLAKGRALVGDEMGLGKTMQALGWVVWRKKRALVICPNSYKLGWAREIAKFSHASSQVLGSKPVEFEQADFTIINYENLKKHDFSKLNYDTVIIDESHKIKNSKTQRFEHCEKVVSKAAHLILLTGTAIVNRPVEFYTQLKLIAPSLVGSYGSYTAKFCDGHNNGYGWDATGATNLDVLCKLISPVYLRRVKAEVLKELPEKSRQDIFIEGVKVSVTKNPKNALEEITRMKIALAQAKIAETVEFVENVVENGDKVIVFSDYIDVAKQIAAALGEQAVCYLSELDTDERFALEKKFQEDDKVRVFVATMKVAGVALTLTAANKVVFNDMPWTPGDLRQCEDRAHRIGQKNMVNVYKMIAQGTLDEYIMELLNDKIRILDAVLDGKAVSNEDRERADASVASELMKKIRNS